MIYVVRRWEMAVGGERKRRIVVWHNSKRLEEWRRSRRERGRVGGTMRAMGGEALTLSPNDFLIPWWKWTNTAQQAPPSSTPKINQNFFSTGKINLDIVKLLAGQLSTRSIQMSNISHFSDFIVLVIWILTLSRSNLLSNLNSILGIEIHSY